MHTVCLINNYNYSQYLQDCVESVFSQTVPFDEVILVDDGSTDNSLQLLEPFKILHPHFRVIAKKNEGQMSCFNVVIDLINERSQVFFLDSDDFYPIDYLQNTLAQMGDTPWDIAFSMLIPFEAEKKRPPISLAQDQDFFQSLFTGPFAPPSLAHLKNLEPFSFPSTSALTRMHRSWVGMPTSSISILGSLFKQITPFLGADLKLAYVDDVFVLGSSILGVDKHFLTNNGVYYRIHQKNMSRTRSDSEGIDRLTILNQIISHFCFKFGLPRHPSIEEFLFETHNFNLLQKKLINLTLPEECQIATTTNL